MWAGYVDSGKERRGKRTLPYCKSLLLWLRISWESLEFRRKEGNKYLRERRKSMGVLQGGPDGFFVELPHIPLGLGENRLLSDCPVSFLTFPWPVPSPYQISSWILTGSAFSQSDHFSRMSQASLLPLEW